MKTEAQTIVKIPSEFRELFNPRWRNLVFYGGRGSTKSHSVARALILRARRERKRILCTREFQNSIDDSSMQLLKDIIQLYGFSDFISTNTSIVNTITGSSFVFKGLRKGTSQSIKSLEGIDIAWIEEAQTITEESLEILSPTIRNEGSQLVFTFNRITELDPVYVKYVMNPPEDTYSRLVNYDVAEKYGIFPEVLRKEMEYDKEHNPDLFQHKWLGEPLSQAEMSIIDRNSTLAAMNRTIEGEGQLFIGCDVARMGDDRTTFAKRKGLKTIEFEVHRKLRTTEVCDKLEVFADYDKTIEIRIDDTGVGGGVTDEMIKREYEVVAVNFGSDPHDKDKYPNWISEAWFHMAEIMSEAELPLDSDLLMELTTRQWKQDNKGRRAVESKIDYKKRGFRSPDIADAFIICYADSGDDAFLTWMRSKQPTQPIEGITA